MISSNDIEKEIIPSLSKIKDIVTEKTRILTNSIQKKKHMYLNLILKDILSLQRLEENLKINENSEDKQKTEEDIKQITSKIEEVKSFTKELENKDILDILNLITYKKIKSTGKSGKEKNKIEEEEDKSKDEKNLENKEKIFEPFKNQIKKPVIYTNLLSSNVLLNAINNDNLIESISTFPANVFFPNKCRVCMKDLEFRRNNDTYNQCNFSSSCSSTSGRYECKECNIKYCIKCAYPSKGFCGCKKKLQIQEKISYHSCDICRKSLSNEDVMRCANCDFDVCFECYKKIPDYTDVGIEYIEELEA